MKEEKINTTPNGQPAAKRYVSGDIPAEDLPEGILPDNRPRKDSPGGEDAKQCPCNNPVRR